MQGIFRGETQLNYKAVVANFYVVNEGVINSSLVPALCDYQWAMNHPLYHPAPQSHPTEIGEGEFSN